MLTIINFKAYKSSIGGNAVKLAKICDDVARKTKSNVVVAVQAADISAVASSVSIPVLAQHVDCVEFGAHTGAVLPESVLQAGAVGSLVNHSEYPLSLSVIKKTIDRLRKLKLLSVVCAKSPAQAFKIARFKPDIIAIEPPELIGGKISVSSAKPQVVTKTTSKIRHIPVLCGAGIHSNSDVQKALDLGAMGVLVASGVVKAKNPAKELSKLVSV